MKKNPTSFLSDGHRLDASFYEPSPRTQDRLVVVCSGFQGLNNIHPERFARFLTPKGYVCFGFDYRGFGKSEGEPGAVLLEDQVRDIANAVRFATDESVRLGHFSHTPKVILAGWGMAGGLVLEAAQLVPHLVDGLISMNGFYDARRVQAALRGETMQEFNQWLDEERLRQTRGEGEAKIDPFKIYPLDEVSREYVDNVLRKNPDFGVPVRFGFADSLLGFAPERNLRDLDKPLLIVHGDQNALHPVKEAQSLAEKYPGPKQTYWIEGAGHTEWMLDDNPKFQGLIQRLEQWLTEV